MKLSNKNSYDETKKLLNVIRQFSSNKTSSVLREQLEDVNSNILNINNVDVKILFSDSTDKELSEEQKENISNLIDSFKSQVSQLVDFEPGITINDEQIRMDGLLRETDIKFTFISGEESGLYINAEMLMIDNKILEILTKMISFNKTFKETFDNILNYRYTN